MVRALNNRFHKNVYFPPITKQTWNNFHFNQPMLVEPFNKDKIVHQQLRDMIKVQHSVGVDALFNFDYFKGDSCACFTFRDKLIAVLLIASFFLLFIYKMLVIRVDMASKIPFSGVMLIGGGVDGCC